MEKRVRSPNYPALSLRDALEKVATLYKAQHTHAAPREVVAKGMGYNSLNGASATAISALHKYGLLERLGEDIKISDRAMRIMHPHSPGEKAEAIKEAAQEPQLFSELAERFPGQFPNEDLLRNYLVRKGFAPAAATNVILAYRDTVDLVQRDAGGYDSAPATTEQAGNMQPAQQIHHASASAGAILIKQGDERIIGMYDFEDGSRVKIVATGEAPTESVLDMVETLIELKRKEIARRNQQATVATASRENKED